MATQPYEENVRSLSLLTKVPLAQPKLGVIFMHGRLAEGQKRVFLSKRKLNTAVF